MSRDREITPGQFLGDYRAGRRQAGVAIAAEALGDRPLHQAQLPGLSDQRDGNLTALVGGPCRGPDLLAGECAHAIADHLLFFAQFEAQHGGFKTAPFELRPARKSYKCQMPCGRARGPSIRADQTPPLSSSSSRRRRSRSRARRYVVGGSSTLVGGGTGLRTLLDGGLRLGRMRLRDRMPQDTRAIE